ncbi:MAG: hypothetical protein COZ69_15930 [Deltaproteobacteria bacterium CG_4_8_14_3_um_filter_45_9]|nr:MAG: hypothetical protein COZ69_15930 [Deltaproteobacteria bacterium CG_4_8_14_3_um_filter_45_9]
MILKRIIVKRFKAIKDKCIDFSPGLNIIKGSDNEAGKSSLRTAIVKAIYQDPATERADIWGLTSWGTDEPWEVELELQTDSESYQLSKSLKDGSCRLLEVGSSEVLTSKNAIMDKVAQITGCPLEVFFESTACIGQDELIRIIPEAAKGSERQKTMGTITKRLQETLTGTEGVDVATLLSKLYAKTHRKEARGPYYELQKIADQVNNLKAEKPSLEEKVNRVMKSRRELNRIKEELQQINKDLLPRKEILGKNQQILEKGKEIARDKNQFSNFNRAKVLKSKLEEQNTELAEFACFAGREGDVGQLQSTKEKVEDLERKRTDLKKEIKIIQEQKRAQRWVFIAGLAATIGGLLGLLVTRYAGIVAVPGLLMLGYWLVRQRDFKRQIKAKSSTIGDLEAQIKGNQDAVRNSLNSFGFEDYSGCLAKFQEYNRKVSDRTTTANKLSGILGEKDWDAFEKENEDLDIGIRAAQKELDSLLSSKLEPLEFQKLENEVNKLQSRKDELEQEKGGLNKFFEYTDVDTDQLATIEEELKWREEERKFFEKNMRLFEITREMLDEAHQQTLTKAANMLEKELGKYISIITGGRYNEVEISKEDLSIRTFSPEKKDLVDVRELSRATQDQFYISARLALAKLITEGKKPPLLLDDPFVNSHPKRLEKIILLLQELSKENQILLFTCSDVYDDYGNVISIS